MDNCLYILHSVALEQPRVCLCTITTSKIRICPINPCLPHHTTTRLLYPWPTQMSIVYKKTTYIISKNIQYCNTYSRKNKHYVFVQDSLNWQLFICGDKATQGF